MYCFMYFSLVMLKGKHALESLISSPGKCNKGQYKEFLLFLSSDSQHDGFS